MRFGFRVEEWKALAEALRETGISNPVTREVEWRMGDATLWMDRCEHPVAGVR